MICRKVTDFLEEILRQIKQREIYARLPTRLTHNLIVKELLRIKEWEHVPRCIGPLADQPRRLVLRACASTGFN